MECSAYGSYDSCKKESITNFWDSVKNNKTLSVSNGQFFDYSAGFAKLAMAVSNGNDMVYHGYESTSSKVKSMILFYGDYAVIHSSYNQSLFDNASHGGILGFNPTDVSISGGGNIR
jgi:hypothetical protein